MPAVAGLRALDGAAPSRFSFSTLSALGACREAGTLPIALTLAATSTAGA
jgi:hypothetical protein